MTLTRPKAMNALLLLMVMGRSNTTVIIESGGFGGGLSLTGKDDLNAAAEVLREHLGIQKEDITNYINSLDEKEELWTTH